MNASPTLKEIATALNKAQAEIKGALRDSSNPFFKSRYADLSSVVEAIKIPLDKNGLSYVQTSHDSEHSASIETVILHNSGEWICCGAVSVPVTKSDAQGYGSAMTYARRYSLSAAFGVCPEDDDGNAAVKGVHKPSDGAMESLSVDKQVAMKDLAQEVRARLVGAGAKVAMDWLEAANLEADEKVALWALLDSKERAALKKVAQFDQTGA